MATDISYAGLSVEQLELILQIVQTNKEIEQATEKSKAHDVVIEKEKTEQLRLANEKRKREEAEDRKRMKIDPKECITLSSEVLDSLIHNDGFYELCVKENLDSFDITNLLNNYNDVNEDMINVIKNNFDHLKSIKNILEDQIQNTLNQLLIDLFSQ
ncbi:unnamed protein product [Rotaria sp. Silwood1]|nr:unnamed protein product [Rotaria sp. Silwood1]CAF1654548.1 unnamed protein product [Rotaria sp. Silwood1]